MAALVFGPTRRTTRGCVELWELPQVGYLLGLVSWACHARMCLSSILRRIEKEADRKNTRTMRFPLCHKI